MLVDFSGRISGNGRRVCASCWRTVVLMLCSISCRSIGCVLPSGSFLSRLAHAGSQRRRSSGSTFQRIAPLRGERLVPAKRIAPLSRPMRSHKGSQDAPAHGVQSTVALGRSSSGSGTGDGVGEQCGWDCCQHHQSGSSGSIEDGRKPLRCSTTSMRAM